MSHKTHETIIIGAGIAGLACARKLNEANREFLVISEDIGGRICTSEDGKVNYGCYAVMDDYHHVRSFVKKTRRIRHAKIRYHNGPDNYSLFNKRLLIYLPQWIRILFLIRKFRKHYAAFNKKCESVSQAQALRTDRFLFKLYNQTAEEIIKEYRIERIAEDYFSYVASYCTLSPCPNIRAFTFLHTALLAIVPLYEINFFEDEMLADFRKKIVINSVVRLTKDKGLWQTRAGKDVYWSKNLVVATPPHISKRLLDIKRANGQAQIHVFHLTGIPKDILEGFDYHFFSDKIDRSDLLAIFRQADGSFLLWSQQINPDLGKYFGQYEIIKHKFWDPALLPQGHVLWECELDKNLYLIGDHNECCLEDAYVTGLYAANRIIENNSNK